MKDELSARGGAADASTPSAVSRAAPLIAGMATTIPIMTENQAYAAMFRFLEEIWERTKSEELSALLGAMSLLPDGAPADPAVRIDWQRAVEYALNDGEAGRLNLK
jgi:hypothetical protein